MLEFASVALVYLDPPFNTGSTFRDSQDRVAYVDKWESCAVYIKWMRDVLGASRNVLMPGGNVVVHCDTRMSHALKMLGDSVFGRDRFASEIVWHYRRWPSRATNFQRTHDVLLRWVKRGGAPVFNVQYGMASASTLKQWGTARQRAVVQDGRRVRSQSTQQESQGVPLGDVWNIPIVAPHAKERTGYPTQKPELLIARLVLSLSNVGDWVVDPMCGSGTTGVVAAKTDRKCVLGDASVIAIETTTTRIRAVLRSKLRPDVVPLMNGKSISR